MISPDELLDLLLAADLSGPDSLLDRHQALLVDETFRRWKDRVDQTRRQETDLARKQAEVMLWIAEYTGQPRHRALALRARANVCLSSTDYTACLHDFQAALALHEQLGDESDALRTRVGMLYALPALGQTEAALENLEHLTEAAEKIGSWDILAMAYHNMAIWLAEVGNLTQAVQYSERSLRYFAQTPNLTPRDLVTARLNRLFLWMVEPLRAIGEAKELLADIRRSNPRPVEPLIEGKIERLIALSMLVLGQYDEALIHFENARGLLAGNPAELRDNLLWSLPAYLALNRNQDVLARCRLIAEFGGESDVWYSLRVQFYETLAQAQLGDLHSSIVQLRALRPRTRHLGSPIWDGLVDLWLGNLHLMSGRPARALALARRAERHFQAEGIETERLRAELVRAQAWHRLGCADMARQEAAAIIAAAQDHGAAQADTVAHAYHLLGRLARQAGDEFEAERCFALAIAAVETGRTHILPDFATHYLVDKEVLYEDWVEQFLRRNDLRAAWEGMERGKARTLNEWLADNPVWHLRSKDPAEEASLAELERLRQDYAALHRWLAVAASMDVAEVQRLSRQRDRLEAELLECLGRLQVRDRILAGDLHLLRVPDTMQLPSIPRGYAVVEYYTIGDEILALILQEERIVACRRMASQAEITGLILRFRLTVKTLARFWGMGRSLPAGRKDNLHGLLHKLWDRLWAPLAQALSGIEEVIVVPHGPLHYIPFPALFDGTDYLLDHHILSFLPALSLASSIRLRPAGPTTALVVAHSQAGALPHVLSEAQAVSECFPSVRLLEGQATAAAINDQARECAIVHVAAHGTFRASEPLFSAVHLDDGPWSVLDVLARLRLNGALVTLSACESGSGQRLGGDEFLGLGRAFFRAGASSLVLSLWPVADEATAHLMSSFYRHLSVGRHKAEALQRAQADLRNGTPADWQHPFFWAPFVFMGHRGEL